MNYFTPRLTTYRLSRPTPWVLREARSHGAGGVTVVGGKVEGEGEVGSQSTRRPQEKK